MEPRSNVAFTSNIYVFEKPPEGPLIDSREFLDAISDPEALDKLWRYRGLHDERLNTLQRRQHEKAQHCVYADEGDFPWGTPVGGRRVVCLCGKTSCPEYRKCARFHPAGFRPKPRAYQADAIPPTESKPSQGGETKQNSRALTKVRMVSLEEYESHRGAGKASSRERDQIQRYDRRARKPAGTRTNKPRTNQPPRKKGEKYGYNGRPKWTTGEDQLIRGLFHAIGESEAKWRELLPDRDFAEILVRANELKVRRQKDQGSPPRRRPNAGKARPTVNKKNPEKEAERRRYREEMRNRPWDAGEDEIIRLYYCVYGADMIKWPKKLAYRTKPSIEARAKELGL